VSPELLTILAVAIAVGASVRGFSYVLRRRAGALVDASLASAFPDAADPRGGSESWLRRWLSLAGYRDPGAAGAFVLAQAAALAAGGAAAWGLAASGAVEWMMNSVSFIPGGAGEVFTSVAGLGPWILFVLIVSAPSMLVRARRRERAAAIEEDLPLALDLFATLAEAGLGFDAALNRILESQPVERPLSQEFQTYQREMLAGVPRAQALRQLARRIEVTAVTVFVSSRKRCGIRPTTCGTGAECASCCWLSRSRSNSSSR
jgi:tight adherence protein C